MNYLKNAGFSSPGRAIERAPQLLNYSSEAVQAKLDHLRSQGFANPVKIAEKYPSVLGLALETIKAKLDHLRTMGFDPIRLVEKDASIIGLSMDNVTRKVSAVTKLVKLFNSPIDHIELMEAETTIFSTKLDKLLVLVRIIGNSLATADEIDQWGKC
jgi:hypothetical protein